MPVRRSDIALLAAARACAKAAKPIEADCIHLGLPATFLADLRDAIDDYERVLRDRRTHRAAAAAAQKGITAAIADGFSAIRTLDIVVSLKDSEDGAPQAQIYKVAGSSGNCVLWGTGRRDYLRDGYLPPTKK